MTAVTHVGRRYLIYQSQTGARFDVRQDIAAGEPDDPARATHRGEQPKPSGAACCLSGRYLGRRGCHVRLPGERLERCLGVRGGTEQRCPRGDPIITSRAPHAVSHPSCFYNPMEIDLRPGACVPTRKAPPMKKEQRAVRLEPDPPQGLARVHGASSFRCLGDFVYRHGTFRWPRHGLPVSWPTAAVARARAAMSGTYRRARVRPWLFAFSRARQEVAGRRDLFGAHLRRDFAAAHGRPNLALIRCQAQPDVSLDQIPRNAEAAPVEIA